MITISLIAAGLVAVAAVLTTRPAPAVRTADERGITLQTLIVTAVLVLMAVAAGVVIVAITRSASDDLQNQTVDVPGKCNEVEVYDPNLAAANVPGTNNSGKAIGSAIGCVPVCVWHNKTGATVMLDKDDALTFERKTKTTITQAAAAADTQYLMFSKNQFFADEIMSDETRSDFTPVTVVFANGIVEVKVDPAQGACRAYDVRGEIVATATS